MLYLALTPRRGQCYTYRRPSTALVSHVHPAQNLPGSDTLFYALKFYAHIMFFSLVLYAIPIKGLD